MKTLIAFVIALTGISVFSAPTQPIPATIPNPFTTNRFAAGTPGQFLQSNGAGVAPTWTSSAGANALTNKQSTEVDLLGTSNWISGTLGLGRLRVISSIGAQALVVTNIDTSDYVNVGGPLNAASTVAVGTSLTVATTASIIGNQTNTGTLNVTGSQTNYNITTLTSPGDINLVASSSVYHLGGSANGISSFFGSGRDNAGALNIVSTMNMWADFKFNTDNLNDIGASGASRPKNVYVAGTVSATGVTIFGTNNTGSLSASISTNLSGKVRFASGTQTYVITDAKVVNTMGAYATVNTTNATSISCQAFPGTGVLTLKLNAAASADCDVSWWVNPMQ